MKWPGQAFPHQWCLGSNVWGTDPRRGLQCVTKSMGTGVSASASFLPKKSRRFPTRPPAWVPGPGPRLRKRVQMTGDSPGLGQQGSHGLQLQASLTHDAGTGSQRGTLTLLLRPCMQQAGGAPRGQFQAPVHHAARPGVWASPPRGTAGPGPGAQAGRGQAEEGSVPAEQASEQGPFWAQILQAAESGGRQGRGLPALDALPTAAPAPGLQDPLPWDWACLWGAALMTAPSALPSSVPFGPPRLCPPGPRSCAMAAVHTCPAGLALRSDQVAPAPVPSLSRERCQPWLPRLAAERRDHPDGTLHPLPSPPTARAALAPTASSQGPWPPAPPSQSQLHDTPGLDPLGGDQTSSRPWGGRDSLQASDSGLHGLPRPPAPLSSPRPASQPHAHPPSGPRPALSFPPPTPWLGRTERAARAAELQLCAQAR